ncbi:MAG: hypothetical protein KDA45_12975 [Planctomycetales bacterium]|nr:hypothetical protein [Planctomycetales bacterium]
MAHEIAKLLLDDATTVSERKKATQSALRLGMPLQEIEQYLDWLELRRQSLAEQRPCQPPAEEASPE